MTKQPPSQPQQQQQRDRQRQRQQKEEVAAVEGNLVFANKYEQVCHQRRLALVNAIAGLSSTMTVGQIKNRLDPHFMFDGNSFPSPSSSATETSTKEATASQESVCPSTFDGTVNPLMVACDKANIPCLRYLEMKFFERSMDGLDATQKDTTDDSNKNKAMTTKDDGITNHYYYCTNQKIIGLPLDAHANDKNTAIHHAAMSGCAEAIGLLMNIQQTTALQLGTVRNQHGDTPVMMSCANGKKDFFCHWYNQARKEVVSSTNNNGKKNQKEHQDELLTVLQMRNESGDSCLSLAVCRGQLEVVHFMIQECNIPVGYELVEECKLGLLQYDTLLRTEPNIVESYQTRRVCMQVSFDKLVAESVRQAEVSAQLLLENLAQEEEEEEMQQQQQSKKQKRKKHKQQQGRGSSLAEMQSTTTSTSTSPSGATTSKKKKKRKSKTKGAAAAAGATSSTSSYGAPDATSNGGRTNAASSSNDDNNNSSNINDQIHNEKLSTATVKPILDNANKHGSVQNKQQTATDTKEDSGKFKSDDTDDTDDDASQESDDKEGSKKNDSVRLTTLANGTLAVRVQGEPLNDDDGHDDDDNDDDAEEKVVEGQRSDSVPSLSVVRGSITTTTTKTTKKCGVHCSIDEKKNSMNKKDDVLPTIRNGNKNNKNKKNSATRTRMEDTNDKKEVTNKNKNIRLTTLGDMSFALQQEEQLYHSSVVLYDNDEGDKKDESYIDKNHANLPTPPPTTTTKTKSENTNNAMYEKDIPDTTNATSNKYDNNDQNKNKVKQQSRISSATTTATTSRSNIVQNQSMTLPNKMDNHHNPHNFPSSFSPHHHHHSSTTKPNQQQNGGSITTTNANFSSPQVTTIGSSSLVGRHTFVEKLQGGQRNGGGDIITDNFIATTSALNPIVTPTSAPATATTTTSTATTNETFRQRLQHKGGDVASKSVGGVVEKRKKTTLYGSKQSISTVEEKIDDMMEALCLDVSMLLYPPHSMALNLSPSQLEAIQDILEKQLDAVRQARDIQGRIHTFE